jgi:hypothetical protein
MHADVPTHYVSPEYFLEPAWSDRSPFAILARQNDAVIGILTGIHIGSHAVSGLPPRPQICLNTQFDEAESIDAVARGLLYEARSSTLVTVHTWVRCDGFAARGFRRSADDGVVMLDLTRGPESLFKDFSSSRRTNISKAIRNGVTVVQASTDADFETYYEIYRNWCERKQLPAQSLEFMRSTLRHTGNRRLFLARFAEKTVAGIIVRFVPDGVMEYAANSSFEDALSLRPNDLLHWRAIEWACSIGLKRYSLGGAHVFLRRFGGTVVPTFRYRRDRTWFRRHDLRDAVIRQGHAVFKSLPGSAQAPIRRLLRKAE